MTSIFKLGALGLSLALAAAAPAQAQPQTYPNKSVTIVVGVAPGGPTDAVVRPIAAQLRERLGQAFVVENKGGAGGNIAAAQVARANPDGYTLLATIDAPIVVNPFLNDKLPYDSLKDLQPVAMLADGGTLAMVVNAESPARNVRELVDIMRKDPSRASYVSSGVGYPGHIMSEMFKREGKFDALHIPTKGASAGIAQFLSGGSNFYFLPAYMAAAQAKGGKVRVLAVAAPKRSPALPDVPTMAESGFPSFSPVNFWVTLFAPKGTPKAVIDTLAAEVRRINAAASYQQALSVIGMVPSDLSGEPLEQRVLHDYNYWKSAIKPLNIKID